MSSKLSALIENSVSRWRKTSSAPPPGVRARPSNFQGFIDASRNRYFRYPAKNINPSPSTQHRQRLSRGLSSIWDEAIPGQQLFGDLELREYWIDWVIKNQMTQSDAATVLKRRENIEGRMGRARNFYLEGGLTWQGFTKIKEEAGGLLASAYVPEFDDAVEARKILRDFGTF